MDQKLLIFVSINVIQYTTYEKNLVFNIFQDQPVYLLFTIHSKEIQAKKFRNTLLDYTRNLSSI